MHTEIVLKMLKQSINYAMLRILQKKKMHYPLKASIKEEPKKNNIVLRKNIFFKKISGKLYTEKNNLTLAEF